MATNLPPVTGPKTENFKATVNTGSTSTTTTNAEVKTGTQVKTKVSVDAFDFQANTKAVVGPATTQDMSADEAAAFFAEPGAASIESQSAKMTTMPIQITVDATGKTQVTVEGQATGATKVTPPAPAPVPDEESGEK